MFTSLCGLSNFIFDIMTEILIGDWECTFQELLLVFDNERNKIAEERIKLAEYFGTSFEFQSTINSDLVLCKINTTMWIIEILVDWRSRNPKTATLGALLEKITCLSGWDQLENSLRQLITQKAKSWCDLDSTSQSKILNSKVNFQGSQFELRGLQMILTTEFETFLKNHINQSVIKQVMQGNILELEDLRCGFLSQDQDRSDEYENKHEIKYDTDQFLGFGSGNTYVYKGTFGEIPVAVKIISNYNKHKEAENEIKILLNCKGHPNIVIYHASTIKYDQYLLALELCHEKTLSDWITDPSCLPVQIAGLEILRQTTDGLSFLHENKIIHRDLKPSNILFSLLNQHVFVKIADFGISRLLPPGKLSRTVTSYGGSNGSTAAEMLEARQLYYKTGTWNSTGAPKLTKKIDIFSLGCLFYKVLTNGEHPFGPEVTLLDYNIQQGKMQLEENVSCLRLRCNLSLIKEMIAKNPDDRPDTGHIRAHPIFWSYQKMIDFIQEVSNFLDKPTCRAYECVKKFEENYFPKISSEDYKEQGWLMKIKDEIFINHVVFKPRFQHGKHSAIKLVRLIRNFSNHFYEEQNEDLKSFVSEMPEGFMNYWLNCFPTLITEMRDAFVNLKDASSIKQYYE